MEMDEGEKIDSVEARLRSAVEQLYRTFSVPRPSIIHGCPCCIAERGVDILLTTPLRDIPALALWSYVSGVFLTVGDARDFRYLLPRILEVSAFEPDNANNPEIVLGKLSLADWVAWSSAEIQAVRDFVHTWFDHALLTDLIEAEQGWIGCNAEAVLCGAARAELSLAPYLARLSEPKARPVLDDMRDRLSGDPSGFWKFVPDRFREVQAFLTKG